MKLILDIRNIKQKTLTSSLTWMTASNVLQEPALLTLKDQKLEFQQTPLCRLISPAKSEHSKVSKLISEKINKTLILEIHFNQGKNTDSVLKWFIDISNKRDYLFIQLGIKEFC